MVQRKRQLVQKEAVSVCNKLQVIFLPSVARKDYFQLFTINLLVLKNFSLNNL